jgi:hypothetical protein
MRWLQWVDWLEVTGGTTGFLATLRTLFGSATFPFSYGITEPTTLPGLAARFAKMEHVR